MIISIDGPSGTGKSSASRALAVRLGLPHLDTGAFYRAATLAVLEEDADPTDAERCVSIVTGMEIDQIGPRTFLDGRDVTAAIRTEAIDANVSAVSAHPGVREALVARQRRWVDEHGGSAVVEGRDIGSVVFPDADLKVYLDARPEVRAHRRALERGEDTGSTADAMDARDQFDSTRAASPLLVPVGAVVVDTSDMSFLDVVDRLVGLATGES
jgi:cytidylate kinase